MGYFMFDKSELARDLLILIWLLTSKAGRCRSNGYVPINTEVDGFTAARSRSQPSYLVSDYSGLFAARQRDVETGRPLLPRHQERPTLLALPLLGLRLAIVRFTADFHASVGLKKSGTTEI